MSASILFRIVKPAEGHLSVGSPSSFIEAMRRAFGEYPWILGASAIPKLEGMAAMERAGCDNPFERMISLIQFEDDSTRDIEVWPSY